jgi:hypothetical protein
MMPKAARSKGVRNDPATAHTEELTSRTYPTYFFLSFNSFVEVL